MPSRNKAILVAAFALAGCGGGGGYRDAPTIALPLGAALAPDTQSAEPAPAERPSLSRYDAAPPAQDLPPEVAREPGPRGTSGEAHEDAVGYAAIMAGPSEARWSAVAIGVAHPILAPGTLVELTALDSGRTIVAMVVARDAGGATVALSPGAAQALGIGDRAGVRVRTLAANPQDRIALQSGQAASARLDAPPALLAALRRRLPGQQRTPPHAVPVRTTAPPRPVRAPASPASGGFVVQVATLSSADRAASLARALGGHVAASGGLYRVQLGPFADMAGARRARDGAAQRGYGDANILHTE